MQQKILTFLLILAVVSFTPLIKAEDADDKATREQCIKESTDLTPAEIERINANKAFDKSAGDASKALKCYAKCLFEKWEFITKDGKQNSAAVLKKMSKIITDQTKLMTALSGCAKNAMNPDMCEAAYSFETCMYALA